jgi:hypothetical protein
VTPVKLFFRKGNNLWMVLLYTFISFRIWLIQGILFRRYLFIYHFLWKASFYASIMFTCAGMIFMSP